MRSRTGVTARAGSSDGGKEGRPDATQKHKTPLGREKKALRSAEKRKKKATAGREPKTKSADPFALGTPFHTLTGP